ncbi:MAG: hypothetical protein Q8K12_00790 [Thiobacillus sp.]|nr:hypothetical protein [Thiobacillus sp.]
MKTLLFAILLMGIQTSSWADQPCGAAEAQYVDELVAGMAQFAPKVTKTGGFAITEEYPGDGTAVLVISFMDRGKMVFDHRVRNYPQASTTTIRPHKTKGGYPGFAVALGQGHLGNCEYSVAVRDAKFVVAILGLKGFKQ